MSVLIIPTAKIVPKELQTIGKLPPIIYPVNQKIVFDYILEQYQNSCSGIDVICFEKKEKVHRCLAAYSHKGLRIKDMPELSDLGHTIYYGIKEYSDEIIINFADTIVLDSIEDVDGDSFFYAEDEGSETWTYFVDEEGVIKEIYDKTNQSPIEVKKLFVGVFKIKQTDYFRTCLERAFVAEDTSISTFYYALQLYSKQYPMKPVNTENWFDIGHVDKYYNSQLEVKAREFNHITIDKNRGILRKTSDDKEKFIGEIIWYLKLPTDVEYVRPRIFSYSIAYENPYISMEYYSYHTLHELFLYADLNCNQWKEIFKRVKFVYNDFNRYIVKDRRIQKSLEEIYLTKTLQRLEKLRMDKQFSAFFIHDLYINGTVYLSLGEICGMLKVMISKILFDVDVFSIIHGDLCFSNIMIDSNFTFIKVIDPRGKFGDFDIYGDTRYELAKLLHSVDGKYDFIIKDLFCIDFDEGDCHINFSIQDRVREYDLYEVFIQSFRDEIGDNLKKIELIEALLFLSMIPLHRENLKHQMVMLGTGIEILARVMDIKKR